MGLDEVRQRDAREGEVIGMGESKSNGREEREEEGRQVEG